MKYCQQQRSKKDRFEFAVNNGFTAIKDTKKNDYITGIGDCLLKLQEMQQHINFLRMVASRSELEKKHALHQQQLKMEYKMLRKINEEKRKIRSLKSKEWKANHKLAEKENDLCLEKYGNEYLHDVIRKIYILIEQDCSVNDIEDLLKAYYPKEVYCYK